MEPRKPYTTMPHRGDVSAPAYVRYPKAIEEPSVAIWASPGRSADGASVSGGDYRRDLLSHQFSAR